MLRAASSESGRGRGRGLRGPRQVCRAAGQASGGAGGGGGREGGAGAGPGALWDQRAAELQSVLRSGAASMTDALLPAAPQPLEKEGHCYFRKVGGCGRVGSPRAPDLFPGCGRGCRARGRGGAGRKGEGAHWPGALSEEARGEGCGGGAPGGREQVTSGAGSGGKSGPPRAGAGGGLGQEGLSESPPPAVPRAGGRDGSSSAGTLGVAARGDASPASTRALGRGAWKWSRSGGLPSRLCLQNASSVSLLDFLVGGRGRASSPSLRAADLRAAVSPGFHFTLKRIYPIAVETCG